MSIEMQSVQMFPDGRLNTKNAARYTGMAEKTLAMYRSQGRGPKFIKRGRVFYFRDDLDAWLNAQGRLSSTAQGRIESSPQGAVSTG